MNNENVKKVIVVCKTHLDIGFTDYSQSVLDRYCSSFIPGALELARKVNTPEHKRFVWTVGSFLPYYYLAQATDAQKEEFAEAVRLGHIRWHRLSCTTHTELMDTDLFEYSLSIAEKLNEQFGLSGIAAKMTDVPGHTISMVPILADHGIKYLHLGVNQSSRLPNVPAMFRWQFKDKEIIVHYAGGYGADIALGNGVSLEFFHTSDNAGPPTLEALEEFYAEMAEKYPNAKIESGTLDDFAREVLPLKDTLPVITQEIGDTWIHGVGTDPLKVSRYRRLLKLRKEWLAKDLLDPCCPAYDQMMANLLLVTEHTWGMDTKLHLLDYTNWTKTDFEKARKADHVTHSMMAPGERELALAQQIWPTDPKILEAGSSYSRFEASHQEQRDYLTKAMALLPETLVREAKGAFTWNIPEGIQNVSLKEKDSADAAARIQPSVSIPKILEIGSWRVTLGEHGEITHLENTASGFSQDCCLGLFQYEIFSGKTVQECEESYGRDLHIHRKWAEFDFGKPGLQYHPEIPDQTWCAEPVSISQAQNCLTIILHGNTDASDNYGCPREICICHTFEESTIRTALYWKDKDANRSPEALWLHMNPLPGHSDWEIRKMGQWISPSNVISGGNRQLHSCEGIRSVKEGTPCSVELRSIDAPLVSIGRRNIYHVDDKIEDCGNGFWFNLFNNRWGTNFKQWFEEDMRYEFETEFHWNT